MERGAVLSVLLLVSYSEGPLQCVMLTTISIIHVVIDVAESGCKSSVGVAIGVVGVLLGIVVGVSGVIAAFVIVRHQK